MRTLVSLVLCVLVLASGASAATADDWSAVRLRGLVVQLVDKTWQPLHRNDVVPDGTVIRTMGNGYADFTRGTETVSLAPNTQIQIFDKGGVKPFTTVTEAFGSVTVDAEVRNVQHFAVETPYLAAVVKGTKFTVTSGKGGASVNVLRGHVEVDDKTSKTHTLLSVGQSAAVGDGTSSSPGLTVSGTGVLPPVVDKTGKVVSDLLGNAKGLAKGLLNGNNGQGNANGHGNGNGLVGGLVGGLLGTNGNNGNNGNGDGNGNGHGNGGLVGNLLGGLGLRLSYDVPAVYNSSPAIWI